MRKVRSCLEKAALEMKKSSSVQLVQHALHFAQSVPVAGARRAADPLSLIHI